MLGLRGAEQRWLEAAGWAADPGRSPSSRRCGRGVWCDAPALEKRNFPVFFSVCVSLQRAVAFVTCQGSDADEHPALRDVLVFVPYPHSHLGCSAPCSPWAPFLFALSGREFSGPRAWLSPVFAQRLGCRGCKQSQRVIHHRRTEKGADPCPPPASCHHAAASAPHPHSPGPLLPVPPHHLAKCVRGGSMPLPGDVSNGEAETRSLLSALRNPLAAPLLKSR